MHVKLLKDMLVETRRCIRGTNNENQMFDRDLPKIEIPKFNGDYSKCPAFKNLQQFLVDEAAVILGQLEPGKDSYEDT